MKTSVLFRSALVGVTMLSAAPALAQDAPAASTPPPVVVDTPPPVVVEKQPAPVVVQPASTPATVVVADRSEGSPRLYPGLTWGGVALWGVSYSAAVIGAAAANDACSASSNLCVRGREVLYIPFVGPFIALEGVSGTRSSTLKTLLAVDGAFQVGGLAMTLTGLVLSANAAATAPRTVAQRKVMVTPFATGDSAGIGAMGRF